ncbi:ATP-binding protein [Pseudoduganella violaceinigra]|uniref:ATP-binding protein n=1 Tax=Pseudoduganella violaceinigra TaxID=246602 RepID=UPI0004168B1F|nr:ATP-binding protein [Pseudoduganella violaceinigra]
MMSTLRRQLMVGMLCATLAATLAAGWLQYRALRIETNELADMQLRQLVEALPDKLAYDIPTPTAEDPDEDFVLQAWDELGEQIYDSKPSARAPRHDLSGFAVIEQNGAAWRVFGDTANGRYVQASQPIAVRNRMAAAIALRTGMPLLAFVGVMALLVRWVVSRAMRPLEYLAKAVAHRSPAMLDPLPPDGWPGELTPVVHALNGLLERFGRSLATQRIFVADAAHELRSPITALKLQLRLMERADSEAARQQNFAKMHERLDRTSHLVRQLLNLARVEAGPAAQDVQNVDLQRLACEAVADYSALAESRRVDLGVEAQEAVYVRADPDGLRILLNNLLDNALRYAPDDGRVDVIVQQQGRGALLRVSDNGPGVNAADLERLSDRFFRPEGSRPGGCGLGLSIVRHIADNHGARLHMDNRAGGGFSVSVEF